MTLFTHSLTQFHTLDGKPGGTDLAFFYEDTTQPATVWKDPAFTSPHPLTILADAVGRLPPVYLKPDGRKLRADFTTYPYKVKSLFGIDPGSPSSSSTTLLVLPSGSKSTSSVSLTPDDFGTFREIASATGSTIPVLLPPVEGVANGRFMGLHNTGAGRLSLRTTTPDLVNGVKAGLVEPGATVLVRSTGAGYETYGETAPNPSRHVVKTRTLSAPPATPSTGDTYLAPSTAISPWVPDKLYTADGSGGWIGKNPVAGDRAVITDETVTVDGVAIPKLLFYTGAAWIEEITAVARPRQTLMAQSTGASGSSALAAQNNVLPTAGQWTRCLLNASSGAISGATFALNLVTLPKGTYTVRAKRKARGAISGVLSLRSTTGTTVVSGMPRIADTNQDIVVELDRAFSVTAATETFELAFLLSGTVVALTLGSAAAVPGVEESYAELIIETRDT